mmetsp:Transcript_132551/g.264530  ORF Transcript_132551/g.264530 Transcript_132551/m.264530 type:complete len:228 (-) Transcript_132551:84-767(-)|eukprot:CAMPEP_0172696820 /NCGR_PEP_ID=MMETSP1074-20121228/28323_1 /TAXON_ID=2916 /ORGANISM="Ceratium fusus, Strain PA161109" /LENGTH=227 /DNA_ID=CAMNT_0013517625 /DNA_START=56 /DNA_END=739 /DNA_ORIENTATION=-
MTQVNGQTASGVCGPKTFSCIAPPAGLPCSPESIGNATASDTDTQATAEQHGKEEASHVAEAVADVEQSMGHRQSLSLEAPTLIEAQLMDADVPTSTTDILEDELLLDPEQLRNKAFHGMTRALNTGELEQAFDMALESPNDNGADRTAQLQAEVKQLTAQVAALQLANESMQRENEALRGSTDVGAVMRRENESLRAENKILRESVSAGSPLQAVRAARRDPNPVI